MKILVTGGAGFIGSHYVRTMLTGGYSGYEEAAVTVLDKLTYAGNLANLEPVAGKFAFVRGDICDGDLLREVLPGHDAVVNFAAETHVDRSIAGAAEFVTSNVTGVQVLLDACMAVGVGRIVHAASAPNASVATAATRPGIPSGNSTFKCSTPSTRRLAYARNLHPCSGCVTAVTTTSHGSKARKRRSLSPSWSSATSPT